MRKIMFSDKFGLTKAVLEGRKTMTRRICSKGAAVEALEFDNWSWAKYHIGEVVAVAQSYKDAGFDGEAVADSWAAKSEFPWKWNTLPGFTNKMFVQSEFMPHHIRIANIKVERLQDITRGDIEKEGIQWSHKAHRYYTCFNPITATYLWLKGSTPEEAFAALIDKVSGKGTWGRNPWVFVYEFELVK